jgi:hypothetical protein
MIMYSFRVHLDADDGDDDVERWIGRGWHWDWGVTSCCLCPLPAYTIAPVVLLSVASVHGFVLNLIILVGTGFDFGT